MFSAYARVRAGARHGVGPTGVARRHQIGRGSGAGRWPHCGMFAVFTEACRLVTGRGNSPSIRYWWARTGLSWTVVEDPFELDWSELLGGRRGAVLMLR